MPVHRFIGGVVLVVASVFALAGCQSGTPAGTSGATQPAATTAAVATPSVTEAPPTESAAPSEAANPSFVLPSLSADKNLEDLLPDQLGGKAVQKLSVSGDQFLGMGEGSAGELQKVLTALGKKPSDLSVAFGGNENATVIAYRVKGVPAEQILTGLTTAFAGSNNATITDVTYGGKPVKKIVTTGSDAGTVYVYTAGDVVFLIGGEGLSDALLNEAFSKLP